MKALTQFKLFGRALAKTKEQLSHDQLKVVICYYAVNAYPKNKHRREWCIDNINLFYDAAMDDHSIIDTRK